LANNFSVVVLDNLVTGRREHVPDEAVFVEGDVRDVNLLRDIFTQYSVDAVVHLAALLEVQESVAKPMEYFEVNVIGTARLLSAMHEAGVGSLVFSSTAAVYGTQETVPIQEDATCIPTNPYGWSKFLAEQHIRYFAEHGGVTATVLRFFNVAGSKEGWGVRDTHARAHLVPVVLDVAAGAQSSLRLFGQDWPTLDGTCVRDYVHVYDIARAHIFALQPSTGARFRVYNVGTGRGSSVSEIVQAAAEVTGRMVPMEVAPRRPGDDAQLVAHVGKIARELGFTAMHSSLEEIIRSAWLARSL
jgi:UDP-glucose 4-epimerase